MKNSKKIKRTRSSKEKVTQRDFFEESDMINLVKDVALFANRFDNLNQLMEVSFERIHHFIKWPVISSWVSDPEDVKSLIFADSCFIQPEYQPNELINHFKKTKISVTDLFPDGVSVVTKYFLFDAGTYSPFNHLLDHKKLSGITSLLFIPVYVENNIAGGLIFMNDSVIHENRVLFNSLETISSIIARVMERDQKERELLRLVKREDLLEAIWGKNDYFLGRSMDVFITKLRKYLKDDPSINIENVHGVGFLFKTEKLIQK